MEARQAKSIGRKKAFESVSIGLIIFYLVGVFIFSNDGLQSLLWLRYLDLYNWVFIANWVLTFYVLGYFIGSKAGHEILIDKRNFLKVGIKYGIIILISASVLGCLLGFITQGIENQGTEDNSFVDYFLKPIFWINLYGIIPSVLMGIFFGKRIENKGN